MRIAIRADASRDIGHGHVMRCLALADVLRAQHAEVVFLCRALLGDARAAIQSAGHALIVIDPQTDAVLADAAACGEALAARQAIDWLILDHYGLNADWGRRLRPLCRKLMAIDDLADRPLECDLLLDQNWQDRPEARYAGLIPSWADALFGPHWALLRAEFAEARVNLPPRNGKIERVLVCFGGSDPPNATGAVLHVLAAKSDITLDVVVGAGNPHVERLRAQCAALPHATLIVGATDIAARMAAADLFIGSGGSMTWERASLGLPGVTLPIAENQRELCARLDAAGEGIDLGFATAEALALLPNVLARLIEEPQRVLEMSAALSAHCDGLGALRVTKRLLAA
ncbi:MAG: UDP-2,4-diacetamido-2,4,6-trideoxy-beta-L-altropyranose hydrolase [Betaproteobacteria bacterium]|nr:UDP-2,4-diacetamido-2,4,6-trideoxy-beta-L-altropyranose hydrolase [Betaproteobacteria bacterium]